MPIEADVELVKIASTQHSRFSLAQAVKCGVPKSTLYERVGRGRYGNPLPTVFALEGAEDDEPGRVTAPEDVVDEIRTALDLARRTP